MNLLFVLGDDGNYVYGIIPPGPIQGVWVLSIVLCCVILPPQRLSRHHPTHSPPPVVIYCIWIISGLHTSRISDIESNT